MRSTFNILFYVNKSKEKNGVVPVMGRVTIFIFSSTRFTPALCGIISSFIYYLLSVDDIQTNEHLSF